jgi:hypothetical protein
MDEVRRVLVEPTARQLLLSIEVLSQSSSGIDIMRVLLALHLRILPDSILVRQVH